MKVTNEELRQYDDFVLAIAHELGCLEPPEHGLLWHYTTGQGLLGIVQSGSVYATQVSCLNDSAEIKYASRLFKAAVAKLKNDSAELSKACDEAADFYDADDDDDYPGTLPYFVACFTRSEDNVSQWQGYGRGENGYAIGFSPAGLMRMGGLLARVSYDAAKHEEMATKLAKATIEFCQEGLDAHKADNPDEWKQDFLSKWDEKITQLAPMIKDPCWRHEEEYRVVRLLVQGQLPELRVCQRDTMMTRHLPLKMASDCCYPFLPIEQVVVGPCPHPSISRVSVDTLLRQYGYPPSIARSSSRPYRKT